MNNKPKKCWICGDVCGGNTYLGGTHICFICQSKIKPQKVEVAGRQLELGVKAMEADAKK